MSNKTPKENAKKTKWARNLSFFGLAALILAILAFRVFQKEESPQTFKSVNGCGLKLDTACVSLERAETNQQRFMGLSGRDSLQKDSGMLFVFDKPACQCFWMKDMKFSIDMLWVDANKTVVQIKDNVSPNTYPQNFCSSNTKYVIELGAGEAARYGIIVGQQLQF